jgi:cytochrome c oxidase subunit 5a
METITDVITLVDATLKIKKCNYSIISYLLFLFQNKCGKRAKEIWPYIIQEIQPTLTELGVSTPADMGYDKPELAQKNVIIQSYPFHTLIQNLIYWQLYMYSKTT